MSSSAVEYKSTGLPGGGFMLKLARIFGVRRSRPGARLASPGHGDSDPLSHPEIARMTLNQLADLPFTTFDGYRDRYLVAGSDPPKR